MIFWRKTRDIFPENSNVVAVTEDTALPVRPMLSDEDEPLVIQGTVKLGSDGIGKYTIPYDTTYTVTTTSGTARVRNDSAKYRIFINDSDTVVYLRLGDGVAVANQGYRLNANGGSYEMSEMIGNLYTGPIQAIHAGTGNKVLLIGEGT